MKTQQKIKLQGTWGIPTNRKNVPVDHFYPKEFKYPVCNRSTLPLISGKVKKRGFSKCGICKIVLKNSEKYNCFPNDKDGMPIRHSDGRKLDDIGYEEQPRERIIESPEKKLISFFCNKCKKFFGKFLWPGNNIEMPECLNCEFTLVRMDMKKPSNL